MTAFWRSTARSRAQAIEWPSLLLCTAVYGGFAALTWFNGAMPTGLVLLIGSLLLTLHSSMQHEFIHGHPTPWRRFNRALGPRLSRCGCPSSPTGVRISSTIATNSSPIRSTTLKATTGRPANGARSDPSVGSSSAPTRPWPDASFSDPRGTSYAISVLNTGPWRPGDHLRRRMWGSPYPRCGPPDLVTRGLPHERAGLSHDDLRGHLRASHALVRRASGEPRRLRAHRHRREGVVLRPVVPVQQPSRGASRAAADSLVPAARLVQGQSAPARGRERRPRLQRLLGRGAPLSFHAAPRWFPPDEDGRAGRGFRSTRSDASRLPAPGR